MVVTAPPLVETDRSPAPGATGTPGKAPSPRCRADLPFAYSIHGLVLIESETVLPELERFRVAEPAGEPALTVRHGSVERPAGGALVSCEGDTLTYHEGSPFFSFRAVLGDRVEVTACPFLRHSPHVLYTNIVEPILRWRFVELGYALVHAACVGYGDDALLITSRTDTGKTTTILRTLDDDPDCTFISDDLTLVTPGGAVLTYPKPLTISKHTLAAVSHSRLSAGERAALVVQARLHSRSGRRLGLWMARVGIRAASLNAIVQCLVPPPKYQVDHLVPGVETAQRAQLAGMVVIQREGDEGRERLDAATALRILLENCDDAYTFPPYPLIEEFLHSRGGRDLRRCERATITSALRGAPTSLLRSYDRNWWRMLPDVVREAGWEARHAARPAVPAAARVRPAGSRPHARESRRARAGAASGRRRGTAATR